MQSNALSAAALLLAGSLLAGCIPAAAPPPNYGSAPYPPPPPRQREQAPPRRWDAQPPSPTWDARTVATDAEYVRATTLVVEAGDTLATVARRSGAGQDAIIVANGLYPPYALRRGQRLTIPGGRYHNVRAGQTGIAIARAYGADWSRMVTLNGLQAPYVLRSGQRLLVPEPGPTTLAERAAGFRLDIDDIVTGSEPALASRASPTRPSVTPTRPLAPTVTLAEPRRLSGGFAWPARGRLLKTFGPGASGERMDGVEIGVPVGTAVTAAADGTVAYVGSDIPALGGLVIVKHGDGWTTVYGHASQLLVQRGQSVRKGQTIALSGETGATDRPALHFELRQGRNPVDPLPRLPAR